MFTLLIWNITFSICANVSPFKNPKNLFDLPSLLQQFNYYFLSKKKMLFLTTNEYIVTFFSRIMGPSKHACVGPNQQCFSYLPNHNNIYWGFWSFESISLLVALYICILYKKLYILKNAFPFFGNNNSWAEVPTPIE